MSITGRFFVCVATLALISTAAFADTAPTGTNADLSFTPTLRPTHLVPKAPKIIPAKSKVKKPAKPPATHS